MALKFTSPDFDFLLTLTGSNLNNSVLMEDDDGLFPEDLESTLKDDLIDQLSLLCDDIKFPNDDDMISTCTSTGTVSFCHSQGLQIHQSSCSWKQYYPVLSFLMSSHLYADYAHLSGLLGLPDCSNTQWHRIVEKLEDHVPDLAEWSCERVRQDVRDRGGASK